MSAPDVEVEVDDWFSSLSVTTPRVKGVWYDLTVPISLVVQSSLVQYPKAWPQYRSLVNMALLGSVPPQPPGMFRKSSRHSASPMSTSVEVTVTGVPVEVGRAPLMEK